MVQRLGNRQISVVQLDVLADQCDLDPSVSCVHTGEHFGPLAEVGRGNVQTQLAAHDVGQMAALEHERCAVQLGYRTVFDHAVGCDVAEQRNFRLDILIQRTVDAADDEVGLDAHAAQLLDRVLGGFGLGLI